MVARARPKLAFSIRSSLASPQRTRVAASKLATKEPSNRRMVAMFASGAELMHGARGSPGKGDASGIAGACDNDVLRGCNGLTIQSVVQLDEFRRPRDCEDGRSPGGLAHGAHSVA